jgi:hypothetical protein
MLKALKVLAGHVVAFLLLVSGILFGIGAALPVWDQRGDVLPAQSGNWQAHLLLRSARHWGDGDWGDLRRDRPVSEGARLARSARVYHPRAVWLLRGACRSGIPVWGRQSEAAARAAFPLLGLRKRGDLITRQCLQGDWTAYVRREEAPYEFDNVLPSSEA